MLFKLTHPLPNKCLVACSGGIDSMAALHWLYNSSKVAGVLHINHATGDFANKAEELVRSTCADLRISFRSRKLATRPTNNKENFWREQRYRFFWECSAVGGNLPIVLAHNMNDCLEEFVMCSFVRGYYGTIPYQRDNCIRPFRLWSRKSIEEYAVKNGVKWIEDPSNTNTEYKRNFIRHNFVPLINELNPGVEKIVAKAIEHQDKYNEVE